MDDLAADTVRLFGRLGRVSTRKVDVVTGARRIGGELPWPPVLPPKLAVDSANLAYQSGSARDLRERRFI